jgi:hypothetical protein
VSCFACSQISFNSAHTHGSVMSHVSLTELAYMLDRRCESCIECGRNIVSRMEKHTRFGNGLRRRSRGPSTLLGDWNDWQRGV